MSKANQHGRDDHQRGVADREIGRRARYERDAALDQRHLELRGTLEYFAVAGDQRGDPGVGHADLGTPRFERAHSRNIQMMMRRNRVAEPGVVGDVDDEACLRKELALFARIGVLVADRHGCGMPAEHERALPGRSRCHVRGGQTHQAHPFADEVGHRKVLTERDQVAFVIDALVAPERNQAVVVLIGDRVVGQDAERQRAAARAHQLVHLREVGLDARTQRRDRHLRPDDERRIAAQRQVAIESLSRCEILRAPFLILIHAPLDESNVERLAERFDEIDGT